MPYGFLRFIVDFIVRSRVAAQLVCGTGVLVFGFFAVRCARELGQYPDRPATVTSLEAASARGWVNITDARFDCAHSLRGTAVTSVPLLGTGARDVIVGTSVACDETAHAVTGVLEPMTPRLEQYLLSHGVPLRPNAERYDLCTTCGPSNERSGLLVCSVMFLACAGLYPLLAYSRRRRFPGEAASVRGPSARSTS
jgi:hypothetical protein